MDDIKTNELDNSENINEEATETEIIGVRFKKSGKIYYFDPNGMSFIAGAHAIVETARGLEYGNVVIGNRMVKTSEIVKPLRCVIRTATPEDEIHHKENVLKEIEAFNICIEKISEHKLGMKLIDVEYTFDNNKLLFYFTADGRIDFRELVKDLASVFRTRIELRQIGIRDEAKIMGGLGVCGRPFCCHSFLGDFVQVSIKMAKEQNLSLNSAKISGACGRLMCCLRYEYDVYNEELKKTPRVDSIVETPDGDGVIIETVPLAGLVKVRLQKTPDQPCKIYHRDIVKVKGYVRREGEKNEEDLEGLED
ncbi:MAG: PSP1 domain-containing protein [Eubacteriales bacterium]